MWRGFLEWRLRSAWRPALFAVACAMLAVAPPAWGQTAPTITQVDFTSDPGADHFYAEGDQVEVTVTFSEVVHVFEGEVGGVQTGQLVLRLAIGERDRTSQYCGGSGTEALRFCLTVGRDEDDADGISIGRLEIALQNGRIESATGTVADRAFIAQAPDSTHRVDARRPTIVGVNWASTPRVPPAYGLGEGIDVEVQFSEAVHVSQNDDVLRLLVTVGGRARAAAYLRGHGTRRLLFRYRVQESDRDEDGIHVEAGADDGGTLLGGTIADAAGNVASRVFNGLPRDPNREVAGATDVDPPNVEAVAMASSPGEYIIGEHLEATVAFDEDVFVTGTPTLTLGIGNQQRQADYSAGDGTPMLRFRYTVVDGDQDEDGITIGANALALNGGAIRDRAGIDADLSFPALGPQSGHRVSGVRSTVAEVDFVGAAASYNPPNTIEAWVRFDQDVTPATGPQAPALLLRIGGLERRMTLQRATARTLRFSYVVRTGDRDIVGISLRSLTGTIHGADGNEANPAFSPVTSTRTVTSGTDSTAPTIEDLEVTSTPSRPDVENLNGGDPFYGVGDHLTMEATFSEPVYVTGTPAVHFGVDQAAYASGTGTDTLTFEYAIQDGDLYFNGIEILANPIRGGTIADASGNTVSPLPPAGVAGVRSAHRIEAVRPSVRDLLITSEPRTPGGPYRAGESINVEVRFSESVCLAPGSEPALTLGVGHNERRMQGRGHVFCGAGFTQAFYFTYTVKAGERDQSGVTVPAGAFTVTGEVQDYFGNEWTGSSPLRQDDIAVDGGRDTVRPRIVDVRIPSSSTLKRGDHLDVEVRTSEPVFATGEPTIPLMLDGGQRIATLHGGDGTDALTFRYTVGGIDAERVTIQADSLRAGVIADAGGNALSRSFARRTVALRVDGVRPRLLGLRLVSDAGSDRTYKRGEIITAAVTMSERVCVVGAAPTLAIGIGGRERQARLVETPRCDSGRQTLRFAYTVQAEDSAPTGVAIPLNALRDGNLRDIAGNAADRRHQALPAGERHQVSGAADAARVAITSAPRSRSGDATDTYYVAGDTIQLEVTFGEVLPDNVQASLALTIGARTRTAVLRDVVRPRTLVFAYTVVAGDQDDDGISIRADALTATPSNYDWMLAPVVNDDEHRVDAVAPVVERVRVTSTGPYGEGDAITVEVVFDDRVWASANPRLRIDMDIRKPAASLTNGSGTRVLQFTYTVQPGDNDTNGIAIDANALIGGELVDDAGNEASRQLRPVAAPNSHTVETGDDSQPPRIDELRITSKPRFQNTYAIGAVVEVQVIFSEAVNIPEVCPIGDQVFECERPVLELSIGDASRSARIEPQDDASDTLTFRYTIAEGDLDANGISISADALTGGGIVDYSGAANPADRTLPAIRDDSNHKVDGERPFVERVPSITSTPRNPAGYGPGETVRVALTFNEPIAISGDPTLRLTIGSRDRSAKFDGLANGDQSARFSYVVQVGDSDPDGIAIGIDALMGGAVRDLVGNAFERRMHALLSHPDHKVDGSSDSSGPVIERLTLSTPANRVSYALFEPIDVKVRFNEPAHVSGSPTVALSIGPETRRAVFEAGNGTAELTFRYVVQPGDRDEDGVSVGPNVLRGASIVDGAGNPAVLDSAGLPANGNRKVVPASDSDRPRAERLELPAPPPSGYYSGGDIIEVRVRFNERVHVRGSPTVALSIGPETRLAAYQDGTGTNTLVFRYRVQPGDSDEDGISIASSALAGAGGITDSSGNNVFVWLPANYATPQADRKVDAVPPNIVGGPTITSSPADGDTYGAGEHLEMRLTFDDRVRASGDLALRVQVGNASRSAGVVPRNTPSDTLTFRYTIAEGDLDENGVGTRAGALVGGAVTDLVGNPARLALAPLADQPKHKVDGVAPTAAIAITSTPESGDTYGPGEHIEVRLTFNEAISVADEDALKLAVGVGEATRQAKFHRLDQQANRILFRYTVQHGDFDADGVSVEGEALSGNVRDATGNIAGRAFDLADQPGHKVDSSATLEMTLIDLVVGGPPAQVMLTDAVNYAGLYRPPSSTDPNVATATVSGHRLTITPVIEGTTVVSVTTMSEAEIILNFPVRVSASAAEVAVVSDALAAMGRGILASVANTIGTRLEFGGQPQETGLVVGGRRFTTAGWDGGAPHDAGRFATAQLAGPLGHGPGSVRFGTGWSSAGAGFPAPSSVGLGALAASDHSAPPSPDGTAATAQLWRGTAFHLPVHMSLLGVSSDASWAVWGGGDYTKLGGESENGSYDGNMASAYLGMDARGDGWIAGGAVGHTTAQADYDYQVGEAAGTPGKGTLETTLTTIHPYAATSWAGQATAWAIFGFGTGEATMEREDQPYSPEPTDLSMRMALVGASGTIGPPGGFDISLRADAGAATLETGSGPKAINELSVSTQRARVGVEFSYTADNRPVVGGVRLPSAAGYHGTFTPFLEIAARHDAGDGPAGTGGEVAAGVRYQSDTVSFEAKARSLVVHSADGYEETGASATLVVVPRGNRGWRFSVVPRWGAAADSTDALFRSDYAARLARAHGGNAAAAYGEWRMNARLERAMPLRGRLGQAAPFAETSLSADTQRTRAGISLQTRTGNNGALRFDIAGERADGPRGAENGVLVRMQGRF